MKKEDGLEYLKAHHDIYNTAYYKGRIVESIAQYQDLLAREIKYSEKFRNMGFIKQYESKILELTEYLEELTSKVN